VPWWRKNGIGKQRVERDVNQRRMVHDRERGKEAKREHLPEIFSQAFEKGAIWLFKKEKTKDGKNTGGRSAPWDSS